MRNPTSFFLLVLTLSAGSTFGKPPVSPKATPTPASALAPATPATPKVSPNPWLHWMLEQDGGTAAVHVPWAEMVQAVAGLPMPSFKPSDPVDTSVANKIAIVMDGALPRLNRPDGAVRQARRPGIVPPLVEDELQSALAGVAGLSCEAAAAASNPTTLGDGTSETYPAFRLTDQVSHRVYYLGIAFCPTGQQNSLLPLLRIDPKAAAARMTMDGACLLVVLEHNDKSGPELAFLNWELVDLSQAEVRLETTFRASVGEILLPSATLSDGRRGRD